MKRDLLDDYRDFLLKVHHRVVFTLTPKRASLDEDGDIAQELLIKAIVPGVGVYHGVGVVWVKQGTFPHGDYSGDCESELLFDQVSPDAGIQTDEDFMRCMYGENPPTVYDPGEDVQDPDDFSWWTE